MSFRPGSRAGSNVNPGTASRLLTGAPQNSGRPGTKGGAGLALRSQIQVTDRPVTQQGLGGPKTSHGRSGNQRLVQDKTYYIGLLRDKMNSLTVEISKLRSKTEAITSDQADYVSYEKRAESLVKELEELRGEQGDYNTLVDKMNTQASLSDMQMEYNELKMQNDREGNQLDALFEQKQQRESLLKQLEMELKQEEKLAEAVISDMDGSTKKKYMDLKEVNEGYLKMIADQQHELDLLNVKKNQLEEEIMSSSVRQEAVKLTEQLRRLEGRREQLKMEVEGEMDPQQERESLLRQIKEDNAETVVMEKGIKDMEEKMEKLQDELENLELSIDMNQGGERNQQYMALKQKEKAYEEFFENFEENRNAEENCMTSLQDSIVALLENISKLSSRVAGGSSFPSREEFKVMKGDLSIKTEEKARSEATVNELSKENAKLQENLKNLQNLEGKMKEELSETKEKMKKMEEEIEIFKDLDKLKRDSANKKIELERDREELEMKRREKAEELKRLESKLSDLKSKLDSDEVHNQLINLERKWQHIEQTNHIMKEYIAEKFQGFDLVDKSEKVLEMVRQYNKLLIDKLNSRK